VVHAKHRNRLPLPQPAVVHMRRSYAECRYGQVHVWTAYPSGGGFDEKTPLICLHHSGGSGRMFGPAMRELAHDRSVYAPDLPGHGGSEMPPTKFTVADIAAAIGDFLDGLRLRKVDLFGYQFGALVAAELCIARPQQVRRAMFSGLPATSMQDRAAVMQSSALGAREDGSDLIEEWRRSLERRGPGVTTAMLAEDFGVRLQAGVGAGRALAAMLDYPSGERLPLVKQQTLVLRVRDEHWDHAPRARGLLPSSSLLDLPDYGQGFIAVATQRFAAIAKEFLDR
jgi:pimeloyl-ACP methyl ester carboxylesterase